MFEYTEYNLDDKITKLELLKPNEQSLGEILNAKNKVTTLTLGGVAQLNFEIPDTKSFSNVMLSRDEVTDTLLNLNVDETKNENQAKNALVKYLIRATYTNKKQIIFILPNKNITSDLNKTNLSLQCYSREHELSHSIIVNYMGVPIDSSYTLDGLSLEEVLRDILQDTLWEIDFLDEGFNSSDANVIRRTVDAYNGISILAVVDSLMSIFGGIPEYDTVNRKISIYKPTNEEHYKFNGLEINDYNYLKGLTKQELTDNLITRLYGLGKDGLTINAISPTGTSYLEDLSFFLYPAEKNSNNELIKSSRYMSDDLALAELIYEEFLITQTGLLNTLFDEQGVKQQELTVLLNELYTLETEQKLIQDQVDLKVGLNQANLNDAEYVLILDNLDNKNSEIENKENQIENKQDEIQNLVDQINIIYLSLKLENHFTPGQLKERQLYIYEGLYTNTGIAIEDDLYDEMVEYLKANNTPNVTINIDVKDVFSMQSKSAIRDRKKIALGEIIDLYYKKGILEVDIKAQIMEITIDEHNNNMELIISNIHDYKKNPDDWISKVLQRGITTSTIVENNRVDWSQGKIAYNDINKIYQEGIDTALIEINSAVNNSVKTNNRGITVTDTTNPLRFVRITNGVMALSKDGGRTFSTAISADGVWAEMLVGQIIIGNELQIIGDGETLMIGTIPWNAFLDISTADFGIVLKTSTNTIFISRERGFKITNPTGSDVKFYADTSGNLVAKDLTINNINAVSGKIAEYTINGAQLIGTNVGLSGKSGQGYAFWAGSNTPSSAAFRVGHDGSLVASSANISGVINATSGSFSGSITTSNINAYGGTIGGWNIDSAQLQKSISGYSFEIRSDRASNEPALLVYNSNAGQYNFYVRPDGFLYARNAQISGTIYASSGSFSGSISASSISGSSFSGGSININSYFSVNTSGGTQMSTSGGGFISTRASTHPYASALNIATIAGGGVCFVTGVNQNDAGSVVGRVFKGDSNYIYVERQGTNGRISSGSGELSSKILKENIIDFDNDDYEKAYSLLNKVKIKHYNYKYDMYGTTRNKQFGFIIDEIEKIDGYEKFFLFKEEHAKITKDKKLNYDTSNLKENEKIIDFKSYDRDLLSRYLLVVCKALQEKIEKLEEKVNEGK